MDPILIKKLNTFVADRDWDQFHTPKNLALALVGEVGELVENFQWLTDQQILNVEIDKKDKIADEIADVFLYLILLSKKLGLDLEEEGLKKIIKNAEKYPVKLVKGDSRKYTDY